MIGEPRSILSSAQVKLDADDQMALRAPGLPGLNSHFFDLASESRALGVKFSTWAELKFYLG